MFLFLCPSFITAWSLFILSTSFVVLTMLLMINASFTWSALLNGWFRKSAKPKKKKKTQIEKDRIVNNAGPKTWWGRKLVQCVCQTSSVHAMCCGEETPSAWQTERYLLRSRAGGSCLRRKMSLFGVLTRISAGRSVIKQWGGRQNLDLISSAETSLIVLPYFLFDCGPYFLAAREALSMMWTLNPTPSDRRSSSL